MERVLFANVGWMAHYKGNTTSDRIIDGGSYNPDDKHEVYNFQNLRGKYYGYVETGKMDLSRIDKDYDGSGHIDNVLVIWTARNEKLGRCIVGWYKNATVYATYHPYNSESRKRYAYNIVANVEDGVLLPPDSRTITIPAGHKGFFGRSLTWFADGDTCETEAQREEVRDFRNEIVEYVKNFNNLNRKKKTIAVDSEARTKVEKAAIDYVVSHYSRLGYKIKDVQKDNVGWDLEATMKKMTLKIEVKGLAGDVIDVLLSNNEYTKMNARDNREEYRLCVVTNAVKNPELTTFLRYGKDWVSETDSTAVLEFRTRTVEATVKQSD